LQNSKSALQNFPALQNQTKAKNPSGEISRWIFIFLFADLAV